MTKLMKTLCVQKWDTNPTLERRPIPSASIGESVIEVAAAGISHLDLTVLSGKFNIRPPRPYIGGVEGAGTVVTSERFPTGTRVTFRGAGLGLTRPGTWAEYVTVPDENIFEIQCNLSFAEAVASYGPLATAHAALYDIGKLGAWSLNPSEGTPIPVDREVVAITGASGAVGSIAVQLALRSGAKVIALVSRSESAAFVPTGAEVIVLTDEEATVGLARERRITFLLETTGGASLAERMTWLDTGARVAVVGYTAGTDATIDLPNWLLSDVTLLPVNMMRRGTRTNSIIVELSRMLAEGELTLKLEAFSLDNAHIGFDRLRSGVARGRVIVDFSK